MIELFNINNYSIDTSEFSNLLHDNVVTELEEEFAQYVGAKYACSANSASSLLFLSLLRYSPRIIRIPSTIPAVVPNVITNTNHKIEFYDDINWVGNCYHLYGEIYDSAQQVQRDQYKQLNNDNAIMIFSFYPTKPVGSCDGGMVVSNDHLAIKYFKIMTMNGADMMKNSWDRKQIKPGYKMHINSIQAHIAKKNLEKLDEKNEKLNEIKSIYNNHFGMKNTSNHLYRIRVKDNKLFMAEMKAVGINCGIHYEHCHNRSYFNCDKQYLPISELESKQTVSIPFHEKLTKEEIQKVIIYATKFSKL